MFSPKNSVAVLSALLLLFNYSCHKADKIGSESREAIGVIGKKLRSGDIIFQMSQSAQCEAVLLATSSKYSHCGIVYEESGDIYVFEAVGPVKLTPLDKWIQRGKNGDYAVKRLKGADTLLDDKTLAKMKKAGERFLGKKYDLCFEWSDDKMYCSELVWKIYKIALGLEVGKLQRLREFNLTAPQVKKILKERYGDQIPLDQTVVSPQAIYESELLEDV